MQYSGAYYFFAFTCLLVGLIQYLRWHNIRNKLTLAFTIVVAYQYFIYGLYFAGRLLDYPYLLHTQIPTLYFATVFGHLYYREIFDADNRFSIKTLGHFIVPAIIIVALIPEFMKPVEFKLELIQASMTSVMPFELVPWNFYGISGFLWVYNSYNLYLFMNFCYKDEAINFKALSLQTINFRDPRVNFIMWFVVHNAILIAVMILNFFQLIDFINFLMMAHIMNILLLYLYTLVFPFFIQVKLLVPSGKRMTHKEYVKSQLTQINLHKLKAKLNKLMEQELLFVDSELRIASVAEKLALSVHQLSEYMNQIQKVSFSEYLNQLRLGYAAELLINDRELPVQTIALRSGFNSESSFFRNFKNQYKCTPKEFREKN